MKTFAFKLGYMFFMLLLISLITFGVVHLTSDSFFAPGELNPNITPEAVEHLRAVYGLDKPLWAQYLAWLKAMFNLDFGVSFASGKAVQQEILKRLPVTLVLNISSMIFIFAISLFLGIFAALKDGGRLDRFAKRFSVLSFAMPTFYLSIICLLLFSLNLGLFPLTGLHTPGLEEKDFWSYYADYAWHLALPVFVITFTGVGSLVLYIRSLTLEILKSDYIFFAISRGFGGKRLIFSYILPNLYPPLITMLGLSLPGIIGGSVIIESIFGINGMGLLFFQSAMSRDYPVIMGLLMVGAFLTLLGNILADLILLRLNPYAK